jgi:hypothetical protein
MPLNLLRHYLGDAYFFNGTACAGKSTLSKAFAARHGFDWLSENLLNERMKGLMEAAWQPAWWAGPRDGAPAKDWERHFGRPPEEYRAWLDACIAETVPLMVLELIRLSAGGPVVVDLPFAVQTSIEIAAPGHLMFLLTTEAFVVRDYYGRPDDQGLFALLKSLNNAEELIENGKKTLICGHQKFLDEVYQSGLPFLMRDNNRTVESTLQLIDRIFGF